MCGFAYLTFFNALKLNTIAQTGIFYSDIVTNERELDV